jgi:TetR/AcrR family transcriptional regulator
LEFPFSFPYFAFLTIWLNYMVNTKNQPARERILDSAKLVFLRKGMAGARMQDIADEAGINKALLHYYFRNKEKLFDVIFKEASAQFFPKILSIIDSDKELEEKIMAFCAEYIDMMLANPYLPLFVLNEVNKQPHGFIRKFWKNRESPFAHFAQQISQDIKKRNLKAVNPAHFFINMLSMCIFPFLSKPLWMMANNMEEWQFREFMEQRKSEVPRFLIESLKK